MGWSWVTTPTIQLSPNKGLAKTNVRSKREKNNFLLGICKKFAYKILLNFNPCKFCCYKSLSVRTFFIKKKGKCLSSKPLRQGMKRIFSEQSKEGEGETDIPNFFSQLVQCFDTRFPTQCRFWSTFLFFVCEGLGTTSGILIYTPTTDDSRQH